MSSEIYAKINQQCSWWEIFARVVPIGGVMIFIIMWTVSRNWTETLVATAITLICMTMVIWWYWAVISIGQLARSHWLMHEKLQDIHQELTSARQELQALKQNVKRVL
jgi:hypothetical protein